MDLWSKIKIRILCFYIIGYMLGKDRKKLLVISIVFIPVFAGILAALEIQKFIEDKPIVTENYTRFYITNKSDKSIQKSLSLDKNISYRVFLENKENKKMNYELKVLFSEDLVYHRIIKLDNDKIFNKTISFKPDNRTMNESKYIKLKFLIYKDGQLFKDIVSQISLGNNSNSSEMK